MTLKSISRSFSLSAICSACLIFLASFFITDFFTISICLILPLVAATAIPLGIKKFLAYVTWIKNFAEDPKVFSGSNFNEWARKIDSKFPNFPGCLKPFRFPEFHKRTLNSLINLTIVNRNENNYLKDLARTKSDNQRKKLSEINLGNTLSEKHKKNIKKGLQKHYGNKN